MLWKRTSKGVARGMLILREGTRSGCGGGQAWWYKGEAGGAKRSKAQYRRVND